MLKNKTSWLRASVFFSVIAASLFFLIVASPGAAAADLAEVDVDLGVSNINPATSPANNVVQKLTYTATAASTVTEMTIHNTSAPSIFDSEVANMRVCVDGANDGDNTGENGTYDVGTDTCISSTDGPMGIDSGGSTVTTTLSSAMVIGLGKSVTVFIVMDFASGSNVIDGHTIKLTTDTTAGTGDTLGHATVAATSTKTITVVATKLKVTGTASQVAGANNELTVAARDSSNNLDIDYAGAKPLVFSGLAVSPDGSISTIEAIAIGSTTSTTFTAGVTNGTSLTLVAKKTGVTAVDVTDGTLSSTGGSGLSLTVTAAVKNKLMIATQATFDTVYGSLFNRQPVINITDTYGNTTVDTDTITATPFTAANCTGAGSGLISNDSKAAAAGVAAFSGMQYSVVEDIYIGYTSGGLTAACSGVAGTIISPAVASVTTVTQGHHSNDDDTTSSSSTTTTSTSTSTTTTPATTTTTNTENAAASEANTATDNLTAAGVSSEEVDAAASAFKDMDKNSWNAPFIARMKKQNILSGYADGSVKPDNTINRAELAKIATLAFNLTSSKAVGLSDIPETAWFNSFIGSLQKVGASYATGGVYDPAAGVSRAEALWVLLKAAGIDLSTATEKLFPDVNRNHKYAAAITYAAKHGIVSGYENGNFGPTNTLTRAQVAKIVTLILEQL